jgi:dTDP-6-deoxy-L-talose 4-dehydrogenase (NAD+)
MRLAVTGATGFIGRHVLRDLARRRIRAVAAARTMTSDVTELHEWVMLDVHEPGADPYAALRHPDVLIHLAWGGLPDYGSETHVAVELPAHVRFLTTLVRSGLSGLVVAGTCMEYGMREGVMREEDRPAPANPYAKAKDALRIELESLRAHQPYDLTWTRVFYLYGEGQSPTSLYSQLGAAQSSGLKSLDMSSGDQVRDFLPVADAASTLVRLALMGRHHGIVNVCSGRPIAVRDIAERWVKQNGWHVKLNLGARPPSPYEPRAFWGDRSRLDAYLGEEGFDEHV